MDTFTIDLTQHPPPQFRIDAFDVPAAARDDFYAAMRRNLAFIETRPGFCWHLVFEKTSGASSFNVVTIAVWESREALEKAATEVRAYYQRIGFDMRDMCARWGVTAEVGNYQIAGSAS